LQYQNRAGARANRRTVGSAATNKPAACAAKSESNRARGPRGHEKTNNTPRNGTASVTNEILVVIAAPRQRPLRKSNAAGFSRLAARQWSTKARSARSTGRS